MKLFIDTGSVAEVEEIAAWGVLSGATTNPSLLAKEDGTVQAWGWNGAGQLGDGTTIDRYVPTGVPGAAGVGTIGAGAYHSLSG